MTTNEKPKVDVPADQPPSYQLELDDIAVGDGDEAVAGKVVEVHYVGVSWSTGKQFDASWDRGSTFKFTLGKGQVIAGWDQGVAGMKVGGRRRITIPPNLAYGKRGAGGVIGPDETLVFVVDLVGGALTASVARELPRLGRAHVAARLLGRLRVEEHERRGCAAGQVREQVDPDVAPREQAHDHRPHGHGRVERPA